MTVDENYTLSKTARNSWISNGTLWSPCSTNTLTASLFLFFFTYSDVQKSCIRDVISGHPYPKHCTLRVKEIYSIVLRTEYELKTAETWMYLKNNTFFPSSILRPLNKEMRCVVHIAQGNQDTSKGLQFLMAIRTVIAAFWSIKPHSPADTWHATEQHI